jgi:hypothetical protein
VPAWVISELALFRYQQKMHLTFEQATGSPPADPVEEFYKAHTIWSLDAERAKLEEARNADKNGG